jgi:putative tryptophan/tyrosine transport system substrate-binding protein
MGQMADLPLIQLSRREFIILLSGAAGALPAIAHAQRAALPVVGFLNVASPEAWMRYVSAFQEGLAQAGFVDGQDVGIEYRWARGDYNRLAAFAADLVDHGVAVIAANGGSRSALAAKAATTTIPIVFTFGDGDPVDHQLVENFNHPGHNITGVTMIAGALEPKRLDLLHQLVPNATVVYLLMNPSNAGVKQEMPSVEAAAAKLGLAFKVVEAGSEKEIDTAFAVLAREKAEALLIANDGFLQVQASQITALAARYALTAIYPWREYVDVGGLISYGTSIREAYRQSGIYVGKILKGTKPEALPVQRPTRFELVLNLKTAKALGLEVPRAILLSADDVIE